MITAEYIWLDGSEGMPQLRSKTRLIEDDKTFLPDWGFDGGSTYQAGVQDSDLALCPVRYYDDPFRKDGILVMCEVKYPTGVHHESNTRHTLQATMSLTKKEDMWFGFEQEYTMMDLSNRPAAWGYGVNHKEQGDFYCGVGAYKVYFRKLAEKHLDACLRAGVSLHGINAEVMPGQWEFQTAPEDALKASDDLWVARYILERLSEDEFTKVSYHPKPAPGIWNGAGCHTNFSTAAMRKGYKGIDEAISRLKDRHKQHMEVYGAYNDQRMTGDCETSDPDVFSVGETDRSCSIRIPYNVVKAGKGYLEDRRPAANIDPYKVCNRIIQSVCLDQD